VEFDVKYVWTSFSDGYRPQGISCRSHIPIKYKKLVKPYELQDSFYKNLLLRDSGLSPRNIPLIPKRIYDSVLLFNKMKIFH